MFIKYESDNVATLFPGRRGELEKTIERSFQRIERDNEAARKLAVEREEERLSKLEILKVSKLMIPIVIYRDFGLHSSL